ncbi:MAG: (d)CMP kinase [Actinobacteria bacterium]|nr:(d)CMP kinase [Actinomycetota bacterium]MBU1944707.1 (d)CMP kinase [Actinomycetota bacterium]MBU2689255.1 (d)CMP kinase [Actinomycetota bacterium]
MARLVAKKLGFDLVDTGAMYRSVTLLAVEAGVPLEDEWSLGALAAEVKDLFHAEAGEGPTRFFLGDREVTEDIRGAEVGDSVSPVSKLSLVRREMVELQRSCSRGRGVVVEGRDIGTVVFPDAALKVFLDAEADERKRRRLLEHEEKGMSADARAVSDEIDKRDRIDSSRENSPLRRPEDALYIDTTGLAAEQVAKMILQRWQRRGQT